MSSNVGFKCPGHCYGITKCPYAEVSFRDGEIMGVICKLPRLVGEYTWMWDIEDFGLEVKR